MTLRWNNLRLQHKLFVSMALVSALLTGAALSIVQLRVNAESSGQIAAQVQGSLATFRNLQARSDALAESTAALAATLPSLEAAMTTDNALTVAGPADDISRTLVPGTMLLIADRRRRVLARYPNRGGLDAGSIVHLLNATLASGAGRDWWFADGRLFQVFLRPIYRGEPAAGNWVGTLVLGRPIDQTLAQQISRSAGGQVVFAYAGAPVVSTLPDPQQRDFVRLRLAASRGLRNGVALHGERFAADTEALSASPGAGVTPTLTVLRSFTPVMAFLHALNRLILLVGLGALLIGAGLMYLIAHAFTRRLSELVTGVGAMEQGNYSYPLHAAGGDEAGQLTAAFARMRSTLDQTQQRLLRAARMEAIGRLAGGVAHDFNNLITVINGFGEMTLANLPPGDSSRAYIQQIITAGDRATALTRQLLTFSSKHPVPAGAPALALGPAIEPMRSMLTVLMGEAIEIRLNLAADAASACIDPTHLEQVVMNFAANARDAMPEGGQFTISTANLMLDDAAPPPACAGVPIGRYVELAFRDTGTGMDAETQTHIFEPFFTTKETGKGTGLGLATIYGIAKQADGHLLVESALGQGTCFRLLLPASAGEPTAPAVIAASARPHPTGGSELILLVEDEDGLRAMAQKALQEAGYTVIAAASGLEALRLAEETATPIDLVFTDLVMPKMGGRELISALRAWAPKLRVLYSSGYLGVAESLPTELGVQFLRKPYSPEAMLMIIQELLHPAAGAAALSAAAGQKLQ